MKVDVTTEILINQPLHQVASFAGDPSNAPQWYANIKSVEWKTHGPLAVGSKMEFTAQFLRRSLTYTYEIADLVPAQRLVMRTSEGPFPMETTYSWVEIGPSQTRMSLQNRGEPHGFSILLAPFMSFMVKRANRNDLRRIKLLLESKDG